MKHDITVGQELYIVKPKPYSYSNGLQTVTKVGRDYFYIGVGIMKLNSLLKLLVNGTILKLVVAL
jgi:hypothetical protein